MRIVAITLALVLLAACSDADEVVTGDERHPPTTPTTADGGTPPGPEGDVRYTVTTTVLESTDHGPQLCLSGVLESYPPQCGGPDVVGWDWDVAPAKESASGTTWGEYSLVGTWDGAAFTVTEPPVEADRSSMPADDHRFATPCPAPEGGWVPVDPATATDEAMQAAIAYAEAQPDVGGVWLDQSINPASGEDPVDELAMNDPALLVLNVTFTGDLDRHEAEIRARWGGALCVSEVTATRGELEAIRDEIYDDLGDQLLFSSVDDVRGRVEIGVPVDDGLQADLDQRHGEDVVVVMPALRPVES